MYGKLNINRSIIQIKSNIDLEKYNLNSKQIIPLDEYLKIDKLPYKITKEMMIEMSFWGQNQSSFNSAKELIEKYHNITTNSETVLEVTEYVGKLVFNEDNNQAQVNYNDIKKQTEDKKKTKKNLYMQIDGAAINTRVEDENGSTWKENKLGIIFDDKDLYRRKDCSNMIKQKEYVAYFGCVEEFKKHFLNCAIKHDYKSYENIIFISDGATWIRNMINELFPDAIQILDKYHLIENITNYAKIVFKDNERKIKNFVDITMERIINKEFDLLYKELKKYKDIKIPTGVVNLVTYIKNNENKIDYNEYEKNGWFVGSGAIESSNKTIVQKRLKQAGMRWSVNGAQFLLTLRSKFESNLWISEVKQRVLAFC